MRFITTPFCIIGVSKTVSLGIIFFSQHVAGFRDS